MTYKIIQKICPDGFLEKYKPWPSFSPYNMKNTRFLSRKFCPAHTETFLTLENGKAPCILEMMIKNPTTSLPFFQFGLPTGCHLELLGGSCPFKTPHIAIPDKFSFPERIFFHILVLVITFFL